MLIGFASALSMRLRETGLAKAQSKHRCDQKSESLMSHHKRQLHGVHIELSLALTSVCFRIHLGLRVWELHLLTYANYKRD